MFYTFKGSDIYSTHMSDNKETSQNPPKLTPKAIMLDFLRSFLVPTLITKCFVLYFGIMYAEHPGEGYGWGLIIACSFTVLTLSLFAWKYRNYEDL